MLCRMRKFEVLDLTDANALSEGLLVRCRKGSRDTIVSWPSRLREHLAGGAGGPQSGRQAAEVPRTYLTRPPLRVHLAGRRTDERDLF